ncbi:hypothetical protein [Streptomyces sp. NPDC007205]|uniref:hypothetical protein n=1 Tax=Streptomyces sp. NPDC007205 TaxID=3154316 RepID=UPI0033C0DE48
MYLFSSGHDDQHLNEARAMGLTVAVVIKSARDLEKACKSYPGLFNAKPLDSTMCAAILRQHIQLARGQ